MKYLTTGVLSTALLALSPAVSAQEVEADEMLQQDTVLCFKNELEEDAVAVIGEYLYRKRPKARIAEVPEGKTVCIRYREAKQIKPFYYAAADVVDGTIVDGAERTECNRTKGRFAKFYTFRKDENGDSRCVVDNEKTQEEIRENVRGRKAIGA